VKDHIEKVITLSPETLEDFKTCELLYKYRHVDEEYERVDTRKLLAIRYENTIKMVASFFFYKMQGGSIPSYNALLNRWERFWFSDDITAYDISVDQQDPSHGNMASYSSIAAQVLLKFYEDFEEYVGIPVLISEDFTVPVNDREDVRLSGRFDLVIRDQKGIYNHIKWSGKRKKPQFSDVAMEYALNEYAFKHRNRNKSYKMVHWLYDLGTKNPGFSQIHINKSHRRMLDAWVDRASSTDLFLPRFGLTTHCKGCAFKEECQVYGHEIEEESG
jgi:hypothetical protein